MQCGNCSHLLFASIILQSSLPKELQESYALVKVNESFVEDKEMQIDTNNVFGDYLVRKLKCKKCGASLGKRIITIEELFAHYQGLAMIERKAVKWTMKQNEESKKDKEEVKMRVVVVPEEDTEIDDLFNVGLEATCKDAEKLVI